MTPEPETPYSFASSPELPGLGEEFEYALQKTWEKHQIRQSQRFCLYARYGMTEEQARFSTPEHMRDELNEWIRHQDESPTPTPPNSSQSIEPFSLPPASMSLQNVKSPSSTSKYPTNPQETSQNVGLNTPDSDYSHSRSKRTPAKAKRKRLSHESTKTGSGSKPTHTMETRAKRQRKAKYGESQWFIPRLQHNCRKTGNRSRPGQ